MIAFNNVPTTIRTPGIYTEVDNSRALAGLAQNPHRALIIGQKRVGTGAGTVDNGVLVAITRDNLANGYFGQGSILARMCDTFKLNNPNTELWAIAISAGTAQASAKICFSRALSHAAGIVSTNGEYLYMMINGVQIATQLLSGWSGLDIGSAIKAAVNANSSLPCTASISAAVASQAFFLSAICSGSAGNFLDVQFNYYQGQSFPTCFKDSVLISGFEGGAGVGDLGDVWAIIDGQQFQYIVQPYTDGANLTSLENELNTRFEPLTDLYGHGFVGARAPLASCAALGLTRNSPHNTIIGAYGSPSSPEEWGAALGAIAAEKLNNDPARPLQFLELKGILPPLGTNIFTRSERDTLLYDGIATWIVSAGKVMIERCITTYRTNVLGTIDPSYLDVETLATLAEIRYQYKARMQTRFLIPRFKLADDSFPVQPGTYVVTPKTIKAEIVSLFTQLQDVGLIENLQDFITNLIVERDASDVTRVNVMLPTNLVNQFRELASKLSFIL